MKTTMTRLLAAVCLALLSTVAQAQTVDTTTPLIWVEFDVDTSPTTYQDQTFDHPDVCVELPEVNNRVTGGISGPGRLMRRDSAGNVTTLFDCEALGRACMPTDPRLSPDGNTVAFTLYQGTTLTGVCGSTNNTVLTGTRGASIVVIDIPTETVTEWPYVPGQFDVTPVIINQGGALKVMYSSTRDKEYPAAFVGGISPYNYYNLQTFIADLDGSNSVKTGYHDYSANYGGYQLRDGRIVSSCAQWMHDLTYIGFGPIYTNYQGTLQNMWWICATDPWGGSQESPFGAHAKLRALHWLNQTSDDLIMAVDYYRGNRNNGAGTMYGWMPDDFTIEGKPVSEATDYQHVLFPRTFFNITPWANENDEPAYFDTANATWKGKVRDPIGLPNGEVGLVWCRGMCVTQLGASPDTLDARIDFGPSPTTNPQPTGQTFGVDFGIYKLAADKLTNNDYTDLIKMRDEPGIIEYGAIYGGPYVDVYGQAQPDTVAQPLSGDGNCYLQIASQISETTGYFEHNDAYRMGHLESSPLQGKQLPGVTDADVKYIRISKLLPNKSHRNNFSGSGTMTWNVWGHKSEVLGDAPVQADGSAKIRVPCETPWLLSGLNEDREVVKRDMMPQSLRPGTTLTCSGCHNHADTNPQPAFASSTAAGLPAYDLTATTPVPAPEYNADVTPILANRCASCHSGPTPAGSIDFNAFAGTTNNGGRTTWSVIAGDVCQRANPNPVLVHNAGEGYTEANRTCLDRPYMSWLVNGNYAAGSPLYWYFKNGRQDYFDNEDYPLDFDYNESHPTVTATTQELETIRLWIDQGMHMDPTVPATAYTGAPPGYAPIGDVYNLPSGWRLIAGVPTPPETTTTGLITSPLTPNQSGTWWDFYVGDMLLADETYYERHDQDMRWSYSTVKSMPENPRLLLDMHGSGGGSGISFAYAPASGFSIHAKPQDAEALSSSWREWWTASSDGIGYPGRRLALLLEYLTDLYPIDTDGKGIVLTGTSMGHTGSVIQTFLMPDPWREKIAYSRGTIGQHYIREVAKENVGQFPFPADNGSNDAFWDASDPAIQFASDQIAMGMHYRGNCSTTDGFDRAPDNKSGCLEFINLMEQYKIAGAWVWVANGHAATETGVNLGWATGFEFAEQDVTLDRAHPAITNSTGNYPLLAADRSDKVSNPRGHYNWGIGWDHANIVDSATEIIFPLKYVRHTSVGGGIPDQPSTITVSVTPRRAKNFVFNNGETLNWNWNNGVLTGTSTVANGTITIDNIPLTSGDAYRNLRIFK